jgi:hypothetical protein
MSFDLSVWYSPRPVEPAEAGPFHVALCDGRLDRVKSSPRVHRFLRELTALHPQIDDVPEDQVDDCPWSVAFDQSDGHVVMSISRSRAEEMLAVVRDLAAKHGLVCYDPQADQVYNPPGFDGGKASSRRPWWKFWG